MEEKEVKKYMVRRTDLIDGLIDVLGRKVLEAERSLLKTTVEGFVDRLELTPDGRVRNTLFNKRLLGTIDRIFTEFGKTMGVELAKTVAQGVQAVANFNASYYQMFTTKAKLLPISKGVQETLKAWIGIEGNKVQPNGYLDTLIKDNTVKSNIKDFALRAVVGQQGWRGSKEELKTLIVGSEGSTGKLSQYYRNFVYDMYSQVDRATASEYASKLKFEFAIYEGGLIKTSRSFCKERNGQVFHVSEIEQFDPKVAKPPNYNPFTDLGGYGCRHHLNYIPESLAYMLRPEAKELFKTGKKVPNEPKKVEVKPAPKKIEKPAKKPVKRETEETRLEKVVNSPTAKKYLHDALDRFVGKGVKPPITISSSLTGAKLKQYMQQVGELFRDYNIKSTDIQKITFKSKSTAYGFVRTYQVSGKIAEINFGDRVNPQRVAQWVDGSENLARKFNSKVDKDKLNVATATHEFAHVIGSSFLAKSKPFFDEVSKIKARYHEELNGLIREGNIEGAAKINLGRYAATNVDEFWAESFTEYKLASKPTKYAKIVGELGDKYFKK